MFAAAVALATVALVPAPFVTAQENPRQQRDEVRQQQADTASQVDAIRGDQAQVRQALADLQANVAGQEAATADAQRQAKQAARDADLARAEEQAVQAQVDSLRATVKTTAVDAYVRGGRQADVDSLATGDDDDPMVAMARQSYATAATEQWQEVVERLRGAQEDLADRRAAADAASVRAEQASEAASQKLASLKVARDQQAAFAAQVDARLDQKLSEAAALSAIDAKLSAEITAQEAALAAAAARAGAGRGGSSASGGGSSGPINLGNVTIVSVRGIQVNAQIAGQVESLLAAAEGDGIHLSGGGYRDPSHQIALRRQNCGTSDYAIYQMSPGACRPPTARPGSSMHERGLAIDFTYGGSTINSRSNPGYVWLAGNAGRFGLYNLPSEPWHWSVNGQ